MQLGFDVWAKDEATGAVALKRIAQTFERVAPSTLALTFSNGETIETTVEHPFYVQDRGFVPAGLVALGNSIVTRAGPSLQVTAIEKHSSPHKVYNFSVEGFGTYFVGNAALWVHNTRCTAFGRAHQEADEIAANWRHLYPGAGKPGVACGMELPDGRLFSGFSARPTKWTDPSSQTPPWSISKAVDDLYKDTNIVPSAKRGKNHGYCAEAMVLSRVFDVVGIGPGASIGEMRAALSGVKSAAVDINYGGGSHAPKAPCRSCELVLRHLNIVF